MEGDKSADVALKPGDAVSIRRLAGWQDIGASVTITGEVEHAGSYGIEDGERLSSVLKRAGGFRSDAYPPAAMMERVQVRELAEQARQQMILRVESTPLDVRAGTMSAQAVADFSSYSKRSVRRFLLRFAPIQPMAAWLSISPPILVSGRTHPRISNCVRAIPS